MSNATHDQSQNQYLERVNDPQRIFTIPRPAWADEIEVGESRTGAAITHLWTGPTIATGRFFAGTVNGPIEVQVQQLDDLEVDESTVIYRAGRPMVCMTQADIQLTPAEARRFASAILEACDQLAGTAIEGRLS